MERLGLCMPRQAKLQPVLRRMQVDRNAGCRNPSRRAGPDRVESLRSRQRDEGSAFSAHSPELRFASRRCGKGPPRVGAGGGRGIRTPERVTPLTVFKTAGFNHSPIPPTSFYRSRKLSIDLDNCQTRRHGYAAPLTAARRVKPPRLSTVAPSR